MIATTIIRFSICAATCLCALSSNAGYLPDQIKTPGAANPQDTKEVLCAKTFHTRDERFVSEAMKRKVYASYGITDCKLPGSKITPISRPPCGKVYEIDHLISLEIGGANVQKNLWPQSYTTKPWNAHVKDKLENHYHKLLCTGQVTLQQAQQEISTNWIAAYRKWMTH